MYRHNGPRPRPSLNTKYYRTLWLQHRGQVQIDPKKVLNEPLIYVRKGWARVTVFFLFLCLCVCSGTPPPPTNPPGWVSPTPEKSSIQPWPWFPPHSFVWWTPVSTATRGGVSTTLSFIIKLFSITSSSTLTTKREYVRWNSLNKKVHQYTGCYSTKEVVTPTGNYTSLYTQWIPANA